MTWARPKSTVRRAVMELARWTGLIHLWRFLNRHRIVILMVHGVMDEEVQSEWRPLRPRLPKNRFERYVRALSRHYQFISLKDAVEVLSGRRPPQPYGLVFTFDDGYRNNARYALPILQAYGAPATFFVATGHVESRKPYWFDRLDYALQHASCDGREVRTGADAVRIDAGSPDALARSYRQLRHAAKAVERPDREFVQEMEDLAATLEKQSGRSLAQILEQDDWSCVMTWNEIRSLPGDAVAIGSHTVGHVRLGLVDAVTAHEELATSTEAIEKHTERPCDLLCYPNGNYNAETMDLARRVGYACAVTTEEGTNAAGDDVMALRRINVPTACSVTELLFRTSGMSNALSRLGGLLRGHSQVRPEAESHHH